MGLKTTFIYTDDMLPRVERFREAFRCQDRSEATRRLINMALDMVEADDKEESQGEKANAV